MVVVVSCHDQLEVVDLAAIFWVKLWQTTIAKCDVEFLVVSDLGGG